MVDFTLSDNDKDILESVAAEAKAGEKYARYYDEHEDETLPKVFPEAKAFPSILERIRRQPGNDTAPFIMQMLNGDKIFVTNGVRCAGTIVWATVSKSAGRGGIKSFLVLKGTPGFELVRKEKKLGIRSSDTAAYAFRDCRVPRDHLIGGDESVPRHDGEGSASYKGVLKTFNTTRPTVAAGGIGKALGAFRYARDRLAEEGVVVCWDDAKTFMGELRRRWRDSNGR